jgi:hypothetical protein
MLLNNISDLLYMDFTHRLVFNNNNNNRVSLGNCIVPRFQAKGTVKTCLFTVENL